MKGFTLFSNTQGSGYIHDNPNDILTELNPVPVTINGKEITPGASTTLDNHFCRPLQYLGLLGFNEMIFKIGDESDLFEGKHYYQSVFWIDEDKIFEMFSPNAGRDFLFVNGMWK
jgi:hypothetical protein